MTDPRTPARLPEWPVFVADLRADRVEPSIVAEWWGEKGGDLPGLLVAYASAPPRPCAACLRWPRRPALRRGPAPARMAAE